MAGYDLSAACTGFIYALAQAYSQIAAGLAETVLVVGTEVFSRLLDWSDRSTCILFGDGAGAVVLRRDDHRHGLRGFELGADGSGAMLLSVAAAGHAADHDEGPFVQMNGPEVYKFATRVVVDSSLRSLEAAGLERRGRRRVRAAPGEQAHHRSCRAPAGAGRSQGVLER